MAVTIESFKASFPEFSKTPLEIVRAKLAEAERMVSRPAWGGLADDAVGNYAAHLIALNPLGESARHKKRDDGRTPYLDTFERLKKMVARRGPWVI